MTGPEAPPINSADDLSGKTVHVRKATSYYQSLVALNERFKQEGKAPVSFVILPDALEDEDKMEMVNTGLIDIVIVDDWLAKIWAPVLPKIKLNEGAVVRSGGHTGWAFRKDSPQLEAVFDDFYKNYLKKQGLVSYRHIKYAKQIKQIKDPTASQEYKRFTDTIELFRKYGQQYAFDPLMLAAQGFQESQLDQGKRSHVGAIGVMQVMPGTGKELAVGDVHVVESNIHAGTKYMDKLMTQYFKDANFEGANRSLFAFASYNAGPGNISKMRKEAAQRGLDQDKWFNNVEIITAERIGKETTTYVRNIYKYYVAYKLALDAEEAKKKAREQVTPGK